MKSEKAEKSFLIRMVGVLLLLTIFPYMSQAAIPQKMNYQGYLTNAAGIPINGTVQMVFSIYNVSSGGSPLWTETHSVTVSQGVYSVILGEGSTPNPINLPFDTTYYLGVQVGADPEMTPRKILTSVGYAFRALTVESIGSHSHSGADITSGTIPEARIDSLIARDSEVMAIVKANDGTGSALDADLLDGFHATSFALGAHNHDNAYVNEGQLNSITTAMISASGSSNGQVLTSTGSSVIWKTGGSFTLPYTGTTSVSDPNPGFSVTNTNNGYGIFGKGGGVGIFGRSTGMREDDRGVHGEANGPYGRGVQGESNAFGGIGVLGYAGNTGNVYNVGGWFQALGTYGTGIYAKGGQSGYAAMLDGKVVIRGWASGAAVIELGEGLDYAEGFHVSDRDKIETGAVLVIDPDNPGKLKLSDRPFDSKVAGIVAGAGGLGSGVRLGAGQYDYDVALAGRVFCNVDTTEAGLEPGDLLTTSSTPGYAMKATDYARAQGAILGKAMQKFEKGQKGQILVLVTLQ